VTSARGSGWEKSRSDDEIVGGPLPYAAATLVCARYLGTPHVNSHTHHTRTSHLYLRHRRSVKLAIDVLQDLPSVLADPDAEETVSMMAASADKMAVVMNSVLQVSGGEWLIGLQVTAVVASVPAVASGGRVTRAGILRGGGCRHDAGRLLRCHMFASLPRSDDRSLPPYAARSSPPSSPAPSV
jgi:hypothetical protein